VARRALHARLTIGDGLQPVPAFLIPGGGRFGHAEHVSVNTRLVQQLLRGRSAGVTAASWHSHFHDGRCRFDWHVLACRN
jgi:hypothetical protein